MADDINHKKFSDTSKGAIAALTLLSSHDMTGATATPDMQVEGVWLVAHKNGRGIVYLAGYKEPSGNKRVLNDFEDVEDFE